MDLRKITSKKADITELPLFIVMAFFLAVSFICVGYFIDTSYNVIDNTALNNTAVAQDAKSNLDTISTHTLHNMFAVFFVIGIIAMMVSSFLIRIHPVFLFLYMISTGFSLFILIFLANVYQDLTQVGELASVAAKQTITNWIMQHSVIIFLAVAALSMVILFSKIFSQEGAKQLR